MLDWILANKEWIFSGVGLSVIGLIGFAARFIYRHSASGPRTFFHKLPKEICEEVDRSPPYQRSDLKKHYIGLWVRWLATLNSADARGGGKVHMLMLDRGTYPWIYCDVSLKSYPQVKTAVKGTNIWVEGQIKDIGGNTVTLSHVSLDFTHDA